MSRELGLVIGMVLLGAADANAEGERTPMIGGGVVWSPTTHEPSGMAAIELETVWWQGRFGFGIEGSARSYIDADKPRAMVLGGSLRWLLYDSLQHSWSDSRDVEVGIELQAVAERFWWEHTPAGAEPLAYGGGLALRVRGGPDDGSTRISESRFFLRVMAVPGVSEEGSLARSVTTSAPTMFADSSRELMIVFGIGAAFGGGDPDYVERFRWHPFEWP